MALKNSKFLKYCCLLCSFFCLALVPLSSVKLNNAHALSGSGDNIYDKDILLMSPYHNMTLKSYGNRRDATRFSFGMINRYWLNYCDYGNSFYYSSIGERVSSVEYYEQDVNSTRGGVVTTLDGITSNIVNPLEDNYFDNDNFYVLQQKFNKDATLLGGPVMANKGSFEINAYNTNCIKFGLSKPTVIYLNSAITNMNIRVSQFGDYHITDYPFDTPSNGDTNWDWEYGVDGDYDYGPIQRVTSWTEWRQGTTIPDNWAYFKQFLNQYLNGVVYVKLDVNLSYVGPKTDLYDEYDTTINKSFDIYKGGQVFEHGSDKKISDTGIVPLQSYIFNDIVFENAFINNYCVMFDKFEYTFTAYSNNNTFYTPIDDFQIDLGRITINMAPYATTATGGNIQVGHIIGAERESTYEFLNEAPYNDIDTFNRFFNSFFEIEIAPNLKLSYIVLIVLGGVMLTLFLKFFK